MRIGFRGQLEDTPQIAAGFIGCGSHSFRNLYPSLQFAPVDLVATCDLDIDRARAFAAQFGAPRAYSDYREMLAREELDAVFLCVINFSITGDDTMHRAIVRRADQCESVQADWGELTWFASAKLGNSDEMTVGRCVIRPGQANPPHSHPNCSEVLVVMQGRIAHLIEEGREVEMGPGDTITVPPDLPHQARNIGDEDAVLSIAFSSADRQTKGE